MEKQIGIHMYLKIKNIEDVIKGEEDTGDDIKRTIHRLDTFYAGVAKISSHYGASIERSDGGRVHLFRTFDEEEDLSLLCSRMFKSLLKFGGEKFNEIGKYSQYEKFKVSAGADYGEFYDHNVKDEEEITIGQPANRAAKIQPFARAGTIFIMEDLYKELDEEHKDCFSLLEEDEAEEIQETLKGNPQIYKAPMGEILPDDTTIDTVVNDAFDYCNERANKINLSEMAFEDSRTKIDFSRLSIKKNKKIEAGLLFADIRNFSKLFNMSGSNLDDLAAVLDGIYEAMDNTVEEFDGVRVGFQGDRIIAVFNGFVDQGDNEAVRMFEAALKIKDAIEQVVNDNEAALGNRKIEIGIGLTFGSFFATKLGSKNNKYNQVLGRGVQKGNNAEDRYAEAKEIACPNEYVDYIDSLEKQTDKTEEITELFERINNYYLKTKCSWEEYQTKLEAKEEENYNELASLVKRTRLGTAAGSVKVVRPWKCL